MPIATVGYPFSMQDTVNGEQVALSATWAILKFLLRRGNLICSPTTCTFFSNFRGSFVSIVFFAITSTHHIIYKCAAFYLLYDRLWIKYSNLSWYIPALFNNLFALSEQINWYNWYASFCRCRNGLPCKLRLYRDMNNILYLLLLLPPIRYVRKNLLLLLPMDSRTGKACNGATTTTKTLVKK